MQRKLIAAIVAVAVAAIVTFGLLGSALAGNKRDLVQAAWPQGSIVHDNTFDAHVARLRRKLRSLPDAPEIVTARGVGYLLR